jgi:hypothetical protein
MMALRKPERHPNQHENPRPCKPKVPYPNSLRLLVLGDGITEILDRLVDDGVSVSRLYETSPLAGQYGFGTSSSRVDQSDDFETRTELVLESERVAETRAESYGQVDLPTRNSLWVYSLPWTFVTSKHDVLLPTRRRSAHLYHTHLGTSQATHTSTDHGDIEVGSRSRLRLAVELRSHSGRSDRSR